MSDAKFINTSQMYQDIKTIDKMYVSAMRSKNVGMLGVMGSTVEDFILRYQEFIDMQRAAGKNVSLSILRTQKRFKYVRAEIDRRAQVVQRTNEYRNDRIRLARDFSAKIDDLTKSRMIQFAGKTKAEDELKKAQANALKKQLGLSENASKKEIESIIDARPLQNEGKDDIVGILEAIEKEENDTQ